MNLLINIKLTKRILGYSVREMAEIFSISTTPMQNRLKGDSQFKVSELTNIAEHLGIEVDFLYSPPEKMAIFLTNFVLKNDTEFKKIA